MREFMNHVYAMVDADPTNWRTALRDMMTRTMGMVGGAGAGAGAGVGQEGEEGVPDDAVEQTLALADAVVAQRERQGRGGAEGEQQGDVEDMPGAFPR